MTREIEALLELSSPDRPAHRPRGLLGKLLPRPLESLEDWARFVGDDLATLTPRARALERNRLMVAVGLLDDPSLVPTWCWRRLRQLAGDDVRQVHRDPQPRETSEPPARAIAWEDLAL